MANPRQNSLEQIKSLMIPNGSEQTPTDEMKEIENALQQKNQF